MAFLPETQGTRQSHTVFFQAREERNKNTSAPRRNARVSAGTYSPTPHITSGTGGGVSVEGPRRN